MGYRPQFDGIRAFSVLAVMAFHLLQHFDGGFLGVDFFFLLSGFLITRLLLEEAQRSGRIALGQFYLRRAARLLPALILMCATAVGVGALAPWGLPVYDTFRASVVALTYSTNWVYAFGVHLPLAHTWSLSVEEQFYLVWPIMIVGLLAWGGTRFARRAAAIIIVASLVETWLRFSNGVNLDFLYHGTDSQGAVFLMSGCLLAMVVSTGHPVPAASPWRVVSSVGALASVAALTVMTLSVSYTSSFYWRGGFVIVAAMMACIVVESLTGGWLAAALSQRTVVWVGRLSYGLYLWHFPIKSWVQAARPGFSQYRVTAVVVPLTFAAAAASYYVVEMPIRRKVAVKRPRRQDPASPVEVVR